MTKNNIKNNCIITLNPAEIGLVAGGAKSKKPRPQVQASTWSAREKAVYRYAASSITCIVLMYFTTKNFGNSLMRGAGFFVAIAATDLLGENPGNWNKALWTAFVKAHCSLWGGLLTSWGDYFLNSNR